ncbi:MAG TPA: peptidyl-prolyl cis-trans isomerase [Steroidobacteraceae bacterium]
MLQNIGDKLKSQRWLGIAVLGLLALVFALWGAYGVVNLSFGAPNYGLKVNGQEIPIATVQRAWQQRLSQYQAQLKSELPAPLREQLQKQMVSDYVRNSLMQQRALDRGFRTSDQQIFDFLHKEPAFLVRGEFDRVAYQAALAQAGLTSEAYEQELGENLPTNKFTEAMALGDFMTDAELKHVFALEHEQREIRYAQLPAARYGAAMTPTDAQIQAWYQAHLSDYQTTESVRLQYAELKLDALAAGLSIDPSALQQWYTKNQIRFVQPERRHAHDILISLGTSSDTAADAAALKKAQDVLAQLKAGADFATLAKKYSDDPGSAARGGDMGSFARATLGDKAFGDALFALHAGELSAPVKSQFGYHIIRLDDITPERAKTLADSRAELEGLYRREQASELFGDRQEQLQQKLENSNGSDLLALAQEFALQTGEVAKFTRTDGGVLGSNAELDRVVFSAEMVAGNRIGGPVALSEDHLVLVKVLEHHAPEAKPLASVRADVLAAIRKDEGAKQARAAADAALAQLNGGANLDAVMKTLGLSASPPAFVGRNDTQLPAPVRAAAFAAPTPAGTPQYRVVPLDDGGVALLALLTVRPGAPSADPNADRSLIADYERRHRQADEDSYVAEMKRKATVATNPAVFQ